MATKVPKILIGYGLSSEIAKTLNVTRTTVRRALGGSYPMTQKALRIRKYALEKGGIEINQ